VHLVWWGWEERKKEQKNYQLQNVAAGFGCVSEINSTGFFITLFVKVLHHRLKLHHKSYQH